MLHLILQPSTPPILKDSNGGETFCEKGGELEYQLKSIRGIKSSKPSCQKEKDGAGRQHGGAAPASSGVIPYRGYIGTIGPYRAFIYIHIYIYIYIYRVYIGLMKKNMENTMMVLFRQCSFLESPSSYA